MEDGAISACPPFQRCFCLDGTVCVCVSAGLAVRSSCLDD